MRRSCRVLFAQLPLRVSWAARGFELLSAVAQPDFTRWSIVYNLSAGEVYFRTEGNRAIRRLALAGFHFSCGTPVKMLDVTAGSAGDVGAAFVD